MCVPALLRKVDKFNLSKNAQELYLSSWRPKTIRQYQVYIKKWYTLCVQKNWDKWNPKLNQPVFFLTQLFESGLSYSAINAARSALSNILPQYDNVPFGQHEVVCRILKGMYNKRPQRSRYTSTWDVDIVLGYLRELSPLIKLSFKDLTRKLIMLLLLTTSQRVQTLCSLCVSDIVRSSDKKTVVFRLSSVLKHSKRGALGIISLNSFDHEPRLCVVRCLEMYLCKSKEMRQHNDDKLFITTTPPFKEASSQTVARWARETLTLAGIDTAVFKAHSTRGASTSKLFQLQTPLSEIMNKAAWKTESTFRKFYKKDVLPTDVSHKVLSNFINSNK